MSNEQIIWEYFYSKLGNACGAAGVIGNLKAESNLEPRNLQNNYERPLGFTDNSYTEAVDSGRYGNFVRDSAGYGLAQWTFWNRKQGLLNYARARGSSIGDLNMQLDFLWKELVDSYTHVVRALRLAKTVREASDIFMTKFEAPANQSESAKAGRAKLAQMYYDKYANQKGGAAKKMKILLISGHGAGDSGATATIDGKFYREADLTIEVVDKLAPMLRQYGATVDVYDKSRNAYYDYQNGSLASRAKFSNYDYTLEVHFNACVKDFTGNGYTTGVEIFWPSAGHSTGVEEYILDSISALGFKRRKAAAMRLGVINTAARNGGNANLVEVCFIDDADDIRLYNKKKTQVAQGIADAIAKKFKLTKTNSEEVIDMTMTEKELKKFIKDTMAEPDYKDLKNVPSWWQKEIGELLKTKTIDGGTPEEKNATDVNLTKTEAKLGVILVRYIDKKFDELKAELKK